MLLDLRHTSFFVDFSRSVAPLSRSTELINLLLQPGFALRKRLRGAKSRISMCGAQNARAGNARPRRRFCINAGYPGDGRHRSRGRRLQRVRRMSSEQRHRRGDVPLDVKEGRQCAEGSVEEVRFVVQSKEFIFPGKKDLRKR